MFEDGLGEVWTLGRLLVPLLDFLSISAMFVGTVRYPSPHLQIMSRRLEAGH